MHGNVSFLGDLKENKGTYSACIFLSNVSPFGQTQFLIWSIKRKKER